MRQSGSVVRSFSYFRLLLISGSSVGEPNWHQPRQLSPSKTSAAWARPSRTRCFFSARFCWGVRPFPTLTWKPMHQQPPHTPLFASTSRANAGQVSVSSGRTVRGATGVSPVALLLTDASREVVLRPLSIQQTLALWGNALKPVWERLERASMRLCQSPRIAETFLCNQPLTEAGPVVVFVVDRALEAAHAV